MTQKLKPEDLMPEPVQSRSVGNAAAAIAAMPASKPFIGTKKPNTMRSSANGQHSKPKKTPND